MRIEKTNGCDIRVQYRMALEIILSRQDEKIPWGFRMTGGKEFCSPFFVVKVGRGGIAERSGLCVGDMVYAINHEYCDKYSHADAQRVILHTGQTLILNIRRGELRPGHSLGLPAFTDAIMGIEKPPTPSPPPMPSPPPPYEVPKKKPGIDDSDYLQNWEDIHGVIKTKEPTPPPPEPETPEGDETQEAFFSIKIKRSGRISAIEELEVPSRSPSSGRSRSPSRERKKSVTKSSRSGSLKCVGVEVEETECRNEKTERVTETTETTCVEKASVSENSENKEVKKVGDLTDEEITDMLTGEAQVLDENKGVIGINFNKLIPKVGFIKDSSVLKNENSSCNMSIQAESSQSVQTQEEADELNIKLEEVIEKEVIIEEEKTVVQHSTIEETHIEEEEVEGLGIVIGQIEITDEMVEIDGDDDDDEKKSVHFEDDAKCKSRSESISTVQSLRLEGYTRKDIKTFKKDELYEESTKVVSGSGSEFEKQLAEIQDKLSSMQELPEEIKSHVNSVQEQLNKIAEMKSAADKASEEARRKAEESEKKEEEVEDNKMEECEDVKECDAEATVVPPECNEENQNVDEVTINTQNQEEETKLEMETEEPEGPEYLEAPPSSKLPHTPQPRPIVLPGGRKWRKPKDAFNDLYIAEAIIGQSEVLVGTTIGVNFCKYVPAKFDEKNSAVCRLIHELEGKASEKKVKRGIEGRAEKVLANEDYQPAISKRHFFAAKLAERLATTDQP